MKFWIQFSIVFFSLGAPDFCRAQEGIFEAWDEITTIPEEKAYEFGSLFEAFFANNSAWEV